MKTVRILVALLALTTFLPAQPAPKKDPGKAALGASLIDINTADAAVLRGLPGIGDVYAARIVQNRPYKGKDEIVSKAGVPEATYAKIKDRIVAKQAIKK